MRARRFRFPARGPAPRTWCRGCPDDANGRWPCVWRRWSARRPRCGARRFRATGSARRRAPPAPDPPRGRRRRRCGSASRQSWRPPSATPHRRSGVTRWRARCHRIRRVRFKTSHAPRPRRFAYCRCVDETAALASESRARVEALLTREHRVILGITGPPGAGKTRLAESIVSAFADAVHVPMDGFHLADVELRRLGGLNRKGAIDTFDGDGYRALLERVHGAARTHTVYAPAFDRDIEQPIAGSIAVPPDASLVVTEGNYLLDDEPPWPSVREQLSEVW